MSKGRSDTGGGARPVRVEVTDLAGEGGLITLDERISVITEGGVSPVILGEEILWIYE